MEEKQLLFCERFPTPLGIMVTVATQKAIVLLEFSDRQIIDDEFEKIKKEYGAEITEGSNGVIEKLKFQLKEYFEGNLKQFDIPLMAFGSPFQKEVWNILQAIPYGHTKSYADQALDLGSPNYVRAVAKANGSNRIAIVVPCHRVIGKKGQLTGYSGGLWRKTWLLNHERSFTDDNGLLKF